MNAPAQGAALRFKGGYLRRYLMHGPMSLAIYRTLECEILSRARFERPVLDVGCGDGIFAGALFADRVDVGLDPQAREVAKARGADIYDELIVAFGDRAPKPDASFRTLFSNSTFEHIPELMPVLREAHRLLAPEGRLLITVPTDRLQRYAVGSTVLRALGLVRAAERFEALYNRFWKHYNALPLERWESLFAEAGFRVAARREYATAATVRAFDLLLPFSLPAYVLEKIAGRWLLSQTLRRLYVALPEAVVRAVLARTENGGPGALVFYELAKV